MKIDPEKVEALIDEETMGVVCIMGNHYGGQYDRYVVICVNEPILKKI